MRRGILVSLVVLGLLALLAVLYDLAYSYRGVGFADMTVEFVVTDAETGQPIKDVVIAGRGEIDGNGEEREFRLDLRDGVARFERRVMFTTDESGFGFTTKYTTEPVYVIVTAEAPGFEKSEAIALHEPPHRGAAVRASPRHWKLTVPISLHKSPP